MAPKFDVYAHITDTIIAEMEAGTPPWRKPWPEVEALITDGKGKQPDETTDVEAYQNATARVDRFLEKTVGD